MKKPVALLFAVLTLAGLYMSSLYNFLLFHSLAEIFSIVIAFGIFTIAWTSRQYLKNSYLLFIGIAYLFIGVLDLAHTFAYKGMPMFPGYGANLPTQLWIAARSVESLSLLAAPLLLRRRLKAGYIFSGYTVATVLLFLSIFVWEIFPACFVEGTGLTPFKVISEYVVCLVLSASLILLYNRREEFDRNVWIYLFSSISFTILSELSFTSYGDVYGLSNLIGHYFKILASYFIYKAIIETGHTKPSGLLFLELKRSEERYRSLFTHMINGFARHQVVLDKTGKPVDYIFLEVNDAFERLTGLRKESLVGKRATEALPGIENDPTDWIGVYGKVAMGGEAVQFESYTELLKRWYSITAFSREKGFFVTVFEDITERKRSEEALRDSELRFRLLSETAGRLLASNDPKGIIDELCRQVMEHLDCHVFFNFLVDERVGRLHLNACAGIPQEDVHKIEWLDFGTAVCGCVAQNEKGIVAEDIFHIPDLKTELVRSYGIQAYACHPLMAQGRLIGTLSFGTKTRPHFSRRDLVLIKTVTDQVATAIERVQLIGELQMSRDALEIKVQERTAELSLTNRALREYATKLEQLNRELEEFTWIASHDLQEPLRKIQSFGSRLERMKDSLGKEGQEDLQRIIKSANRMASLIKSLRSYSEATRGADSFKTTDLSMVVEEAVSDLELAIREGGGVIEVSSLPSIEMDAVKIRQLFQNLISNSIRYARENEKPVVKISGQVVDGMCEIQVKDNGIGFEEQYLEKIFTPFQRLHGRTSRYEGTGMGLAICRKVVEMHGGSITARSTPGQGTTFIISLPVRQQK